MFKQLLKDIKRAQKKSKFVSLSGKRDLRIPDILAVSLNNAEVVFDLSQRQKKLIKNVREHMLQQVKSGIPIYGATTAYGARNKQVLTEGIQKERLDKATALSKAIIHVDVSTGPPVPRKVTRAAMLIRINMLLSGVSAVRISTLRLLAHLLNARLTPVVGQYGSIGASGDLAQNGRVIAVLLQLPTAKVWNKKGKIEPAKTALERLEIKPLKLRPKEGLALVNGDNFSTAAAMVLAYEVARLMLVNTATSALTIQALFGSVRNFHPMLEQVRSHPGQSFVASLLRNLLKDSKLARQELTGHKKRSRGEEIQDPYSIRCLPQYSGIDWEYLAHAWKTIDINANSVSDNPIWTTPDYVTENEKPYQWISGGNFLAMFMSETLDHLRKMMVRIVKQTDRHLARLVHPAFNNGLPANLSDPQDISRCTFKGLQTQLGMYDIYSTILANPVSTAFGIHEEFNQDITSHAMTSAILTFEALRLAKLAVATGLIASCQAIDFRGGPKLLSPASKPLYEWLRNQVPYIKKPQPLGNYVEQVADNLEDSKLIKSILKESLTMTTE